MRRAVACTFAKSAVCESVNMKKSEITARHKRKGGGRQVAQTRYKMPRHIRQAVVCLCRCYSDARALGNIADSYSRMLVKAVDASLCNVGSDLENSALRAALKTAIWESTLNGRRYPYEVWNLPTIYRDNFYERKRKFLKEIANEMGLPLDADM